MILVIITIVAFGFLYDRYSPQGPGTNKLGQIYKRDIPISDLDRAHRYLRLAISLGMMDMVQTLVPRAPDEESAAMEFLVNLEVLRHEAKSFAIEPTLSQITDGIKALPAFQTNG
ncbi:MAG: SurA N-terminal domain-containing protein, partial [Chthoniobacterales bacterium]